MKLQATLAIIVCGMVAAIGVMFFLRPPDASNQLLTALVSTVLTVFVMICSYYFGSSPGSKDKDNTIKQIALGTPAADDKPLSSAAKLASVS